MNKQFPVILNNEQVGAISLTPDAVKYLEKLMEVKFEDFDKEPFTVAFSFQVDTHHASIKLTDAIITTWVNE